MSAAEIIRQVAALPPEERTVFLELLRDMQNGDRPNKPHSGPEWPDFAQRLRSIYGDKVVPDSEQIIAEGRGDR